MPVALLRLRRHAGFIVYSHRCCVGPPPLHFCKGPCRWLVGVRDGNQPHWQRPNHICRSVLGCTRKPQRRRSILFPVVWYRGARPTPSIFACAAADDHAFPSTTVAEQRQLESHPGRVTLVMGGVCAHDYGFYGVQRSHCCLQPVNPWVGSEWQIYNGECVVDYVECGMLGEARPHAGCRVLSVATDA